MQNHSLDAIELSLFAARVAAIGEEMGAVLGRSAVSPNIRDRLDYSCALFDPAGRLIGQATHIPVHLGSMAYAMTGLVSAYRLQEGDVLAVNDPFNGGTHLPDVTLIAPVYQQDRLQGFVANRAHHPDIGSESPGSMPLSTCLQDEGLIIPPTFLYRGGQRQREAWSGILKRLREPGLSAADFNAQISANRVGKERLLALIQRMGEGEFAGRCQALQAYAGRLAKASLAVIPSGRYQFCDYMDGDGHGGTDLPVQVSITAADGAIGVDFSGSADQVQGNINCPLPVTAAAVQYVLRCLLPEDAPNCAGLMDAVSIKAPPGCLVNAAAPAAVAAGNVETSMRVVDALCGALAQALPQQIPAAGQGSMNNIAMGAGGADGWDYYETLGGGSGGGFSYPGLSGRQVHMTNTLNTPVEVVERHFPLRILSYGLRPGSGGEGSQRGGDGQIRRYRFLGPARVSLLTERRSRGPWGLGSGGHGLPGENRLGERLLPGKCEFQVEAGDELEIRTPGGGGWSASD